MQFDQMQIHITKHAHDQYCGRVEPMNMEQLQDHIKSSIATGDYERRDEYIQIQDVWWVYVTNSSTLTLVTCYGRSTIDLPRAVKWAQRYRDRIDLDHLPYIASHSLA